MSDRLVIEITGTLPEDDKYAILAAAQVAAKTMSADLMGQYTNLALAATVRSVRPGKPKTARPAVRAVSEAAE